MSLSKNHRKIRPHLGKAFPENDEPLPGAGGFALTIGDALRRQFGGTTAAVKMVVALTGANARAVRNWFAAKNGPSGENLIDLMRHSDEVLEAVLVMAGRVDLAKVKKLGDARKQLQQMLALIDEIEAR
ncbi:hypothetical protein [Paramagnetospirillum magnetotacticum]|nr:hypothetical protein [Paramagnetospirillum magnetotacticum]